jgi:hypothetical protein
MREQAQVCAYCDAAEGGDRMHLPDVATFRLGMEVVAFHLPSAPPERSAMPLNAVFCRWRFKRSGERRCTRAGCWTDRASLAVCGDSGTGKSTLACALSARAICLSMRSRRS